MKPTTDTPRTISAMSLKKNYELSEKDCPVYENYVHAEVCAEIERELAEAKREAEYLATALNRRYYAEEAPNWGLCDSVAGVISQIDNMAAGLGQRAEKAEAEVERLRANLVRAVEIAEEFWNNQKQARKAHLETCKNAQREIDKLHAENVCLQELIQEFYEWSRRDYPTESEVREIMDRYYNLLNK